MKTSNRATLAHATQIAAITGHTVDTVWNALSGGACRRSTRTAVESAAQRLGLAHLMNREGLVEIANVATERQDDASPRR